MKFSDIDMKELYSSIIANKELLAVVIASEGERYHAEIDLLDSVGILDIANWHESPLDAVESFALDYGLIADESELSEQFDSMIDTCSSAETLLMFNNASDQPMMCEAFNNWTDSMCKDGTIHDLQYNEYEYVGRFDMG